MTDEADACAWPELLYRFAEHYRWEPHRLCKSVKEFQNALRRQEVPLNYSFQLLRRWLRPAAIRAILKPFGLKEGLELGPLRLKAPVDTYFTQADVRLESEISRIYIENKIGSKLDSVQVQKYLLLHAEMDRHQKKQPYLLILTPGEFAKSWKPLEDASGDIQDFLHTRVKEAPIENLIGCVGHKKLAEYRPQYSAVKDTISYGAATWKSRGRMPCDALRRLQIRWPLRRPSDSK